LKRTVPAVLFASAIALAACGSSSSSSTPTTASGAAPTTASGAAPTTASGAAPTTASGAAPTTASGVTTTSTGSTPPTTPPATAPPVKGAKTTLTEDGSSLLFPYLEAVAAKFHAADPSLGVNTEAGGSGLGISDAAAGNKSFGGSDAYLSPTDFSEYPGLQDIPVVVSSQSVDYNLKGIKNLKLSGAVLASIYEGKITMWNDPAIKKLNPGVTLPAEKVVPIHREDSSGDTFLFTSFLSATNPTTWGKTIGEDTTVNWPSVSGSASATGNPGMVQAAQSTKGAVAYIGISAQSKAVAAGLGQAELENQSGKFLLPTSSTVDSAVQASLSKVPADLAASLIYASGPNSYPIVNFEYIIVKDKQPSTTIAQAIQTFLKYVISPTEGSSMANLGADQFEALPSAIVPKVKAAIAAIK
jgi:phosphate transport system substrate-binding protein